MILVMNIDQAYVNTVLDRAYANEPEYRQWQTSLELAMDLIKWEEGFKDLPVHSAYEMVVEYRKNRK